MPEKCGKNEIQVFRAGDTDISVNIRSNSISIYDLNAWQLLEENNPEGSMQLPTISKVPGCWELRNAASQVPPRSYLNLRLGI